MRHCGPCLALKDSLEGKTLCHPLSAVLLNHSVVRKSSLLSLGIGSQIEPTPNVCHAARWTEVANDGANWAVVGSSSNRKLTHYPISRRKSARPCCRRLRLPAGCRRAFGAPIPGVPKLPGYPAKSSSR